MYYMYYKSVFSRLKGTLCTKKPAEGFIFNKETHCPVDCRNYVSVGTSLCISSLLSWSQYSCSHVREKASALTGLYMVSK